MLGRLYLKGTSREFGFLYWIVYVFVFISLLSIPDDYVAKYALIALLVITVAYTSTNYIGQNGLKLNLKFFAREQIKWCQMREGHLNEVEVFVADLSGALRTITLICSGKTSKEALQEMLQQYNRREDL